MPLSYPRIPCSSLPISFRRRFWSLSSCSLPALSPFCLITAVVLCPFPMCRSIYVPSPEVLSSHSDTCIPSLSCSDTCIPFLPSCLFIMTRRPKMSFSCPFYKIRSLPRSYYVLLRMRPYVSWPSPILKDIVFTGGVHADVPIPLSIYLWVELCSYI